MGRAFRASGTAMSHDRNLRVGTGAVTLSIWVRYTANQSGYGRWLTCRFGDRLLMRANGTTVEAGVNATGGGGVSVAGQTGLAQLTFDHFVLATGGIGTTGVLYKNGAQIGSFGQPQAINGATTLVDIGGVSPNTTETPPAVLAEPAIWNVQLTAAEVALLAAGQTPLRIRPGALAHYWPLRAAGGNVEGELLSGTLIFARNQGSDHPRVVLPPQFRR